MNGDAFNDLIIGAPGVDRFIPAVANRAGGTYVVLGAEFQPEIDIQGNDRSIISGDTRPFIRTAYARSTSDDGCISPLAN